MAAIGWISLADALTYFVTRIGADASNSAGWASLTDPVRTALLTTAYNRINNDPMFTIPASPSAAELAKLEIVQCELSWYMQIHILAEDKRKGIQAQGVIEAGIVKEKYYTEDLHTVPYPPIVLTLLEGFNNEISPIALTEIDRDPTKAIDENAVLTTD